MGHLLRRLIDRDDPRSVLGHGDRHRSATATEFEHALAVERAEQSELRLGRNVGAVVDDVEREIGPRRPRRERACGQHPRLRVRRTDRARRRHSQRRALQGSPCGAPMTLAVCERPAPSFESQIDDLTAVATIPSMSGGPLFFVHVMKTGGTTFRRRLVQEFGAEAVFPYSRLDPSDGQPNVQVEYLTSLSPDRLARIKAFSGHYPFFATELLPRPSHVLTILRDPVERTISHLKQHHRSRGLGPERSLESIYDLEMHRTLHMLNYQVRVFASTADEGIRSVFRTGSTSTTGAWRLPRSIFAGSTFSVSPSASTSFRPESSNASDGDPTSASPNSESPSRNPCQSRSAAGSQRTTRPIWSSTCTHGTWRRRSPASRRIAGGTRRFP